jgi:hypothetical protein
MQNELQAKIDKFYAEVRAAAILIAIDWAGSAAALAEALGYDRFAGNKWVERGRIPPFAAVRMVKLKGFPLSTDELCPGEDLSRYRYFSCPRCHRTMNGPRIGSGCSPLLKDGRYRAVKKRRAQIAKRNSNSGS